MRALLCLVLSLAALCAQEGEVEPCELETGEAGETPTPVVELRRGGVAPALPIEVWVQGEPLEALSEAGRPLRGLTLVEFFWVDCPACEECIPILAELQDRYGELGLDVVSVTIWDSAASVRRFLEPRQAFLRYRMAIGTPEVIRPNWIEAGDVDVVPHAFLIDEERVLRWSGDPRERGLAGELLQLLGDGLDRDERSAELRALAEAELQILDIRRQISLANRERRLRDAADLLDQLIARDARRFADCIAERYQLTLQRLKLPREAHTFLRKHWHALDEDARALGNLGRIALANTYVPRDPELGLMLAQRANELTDHEHAPFLELESLGHEQVGDLPQAIALLEQACERAPTPLKRRFEKKLEALRAQVQE